MDDASIYLEKATQSLSAPESELANRRFDNCANRSYYACFQAAVAALIRANVHPPGDDGRWGHDFVQARFAGDLVRRRKLYSAQERDTLERLFLMQQVADYSVRHVTDTQAARVVQRAANFVEAIRAKQG